jgi:hypothetical protein
MNTITYSPYLHDSISQHQMKYSGIKISGQNLLRRALKYMHLVLCKYVNNWNTDYTYRKSKQKTWLSNSWVTNQQQFEQIITRTE